ncbi:FlgO family outer membrane protein [Desulfomicrobium salsuginis]
MRKIILTIISLLFVSGCVAGAQQSIMVDPTYADAANSKFVEANYKATDALMSSLTQQLDNRVPLVVSTIVNIDELTESSRLGRTISEQIGSRLTNLGYQVVELKLRSNIFVKRSEGELLLSREISEVMRNHRAQAVVVGTYSVANNFVYINLKAVSNFDNVIVAAHDYILPIDRNVSSLLRSKQNK